MWLTLVWVHFEAVLLWSAGALAQLLLPAQLERARGEQAAFFGGLFDWMAAATLTDALVFAAVWLVLEPFYVAAGFALYLNRRTLLEGWDIEVALRRIAERHAPALAVFILSWLCLLMPMTAYAQDKNPKAEVAEVLKDRQFGYFRDTTVWRLRDPFEPKKPEPRANPFEGIGYALARTLQVLFWVLAVAGGAYLLWRAAKLLPRAAAPPRAAYRAPGALFGMELAPDKLPPDVPQAASALAREGRLREALGLLYRGALSELVHKRGVQLLPGHTEGEAVRLAGLPYFASLVEAWRACAYARREPPAAQVQALAQMYRKAFA